MVSSKDLKEIVRILSDDENVEKILLFGSYAHGTANEDSDLDLAIITETEILGYQRQIKFLKALREGQRRWHFAMDIVVYTPEEFEIHRNNQYHLIHEIVMNGKILYERQRSIQLVA
jgi:uncharacterized protein